MTHLLTAAEMREIEAHAMESGIVTGRELMDRAGRRVVEAIQTVWPDAERASRRAAVLCGPGNNGGDGFVIARLLHGLGWTVEVSMLGSVETMPADACVNAESWQELGPIHALDAHSNPCAAAPDLVIDALFGTGLSRPLEGLDSLLSCLRAAHGQGRSRIVAVDIPSGLCADSGRVLGGAGAAIPAHLTVSFHRAKRGHYLSDGPALCGSLVVGDIGLRPEATEGRGVPLVAARARELSKGQGGHKYDSGHALVMTGGAGTTGAARLAARAALRVGAGLVTTGVPGSAQFEVAAQQTAVMLRRIDDGGALADMLEGDGRLNAVCLGPGLGATRALDLVPAALAARRATVLDADALTAFSDAPDTFFDALHADCVLTPHMGEFARLFPDLASPLTDVAKRGPAPSRIDAALAAANRSGAVILLKGPDTIVAAPDGRVSVAAAVYDRAAPWLATAGAGDVLAGMITGLMARGMPAMRAAETAAWLHAECARCFGPGLIAEDLPEALPGVFRTLGI
ncbi:NAD(P)H-hydrate dehydratase [Roseivivax marinus]|uniref:NAD(P)H-hydrate dehydratase n=1 Tax=Roseivivax marinus TaxID=1379903 RepID=UPI00273F6414|nr:NAD(P)H-hydrate dehydratase [Roseivivax marinus]